MCLMASGRLSLTHTGSQVTHWLLSPVVTDGSPAHSYRKERNLFSRHRVYLDKSFSEINLRKAIDLSINTSAGHSLD